MDKNYDLNLSVWGPYNKGYLGAAHVADYKNGLRFDVNLFPGYYRRSVMLPKDLADTGAKILAASQDLSHYIYRYELEWKDKVYIEADFKSENNIMTITCDFVNETDFPESLGVNAVVSMHCCSFNHREIYDFKAILPKNCLWLNSADYDSINSDCSVAYDGLYKAEARESGFVGGSYLTKGMFGKEGHFAHYNFDPIASDSMGIRYRGSGNITIALGNEEYDISLPVADELNFYTFPIKESEIKDLIIFTHNSSVDIDGFAIGKNTDKCEFESVFKGEEPEIIQSANGFTAIFEGKSYSIETDSDDFMVRRLITDDIGQLLTDNIHNHVSTTIKGNGDSQSVDLFIRPIFLHPKSNKKVIIRISAPESPYKFDCDHTIFEPECNSNGEKYRLSQKIMAATTLTNVVWPIYCRRGYIRHNTPGRNWDSLYTWDSGFIGMGLNSIDKNRGIDCLNTYMTPVGDMHSPYIFHGTPLPTQIFLFAEIFNNTGDMEFVKKYYPLIKHQYDYFSDMKHSEYAKSTGMFSLWHIFYNSGGWDDYPPQKFVHDNNMEDYVCPVINTAMTVLCAKVLKPFAQMLGEDIKQFDDDIEFYSNAINKYAWDEESGYYGYIVHGEKPEILRNMGVNADMGMDGAFPYIAGISNESRSRRILENIKLGMVTDIGVSVVDRRAPYYSTDGYWNGSVWMPHQWILWKALLDKGEIELADKIAKTALDLWATETGHTYNCYEHFMIANGRGAGFHQFSGLSTPVLMWFNAYFKPYTITGGFQTIISERREENGNLSFKINANGDFPCIIVCLDERYKYDIQTIGKTQKLSDSVYAISFDGKSKDNITIRRR